MNRDIRVFTELDTLFDYRRGLLQWLMTEGIGDPTRRKVEGDRLWELHAAKYYNERRMDVFDFPGFKIDAKFKELYEKRSTEHWLMYYPTNFGKSLIKTVLDLEGFEDKPIDIRSLTLFINTKPYDLDDALKEDLVKHCQIMFKGYVKIKLVEIDNDKVDSGYYKQYNYVYRYDILSGKNTEVFMNSIKENPIPNTTFLVPDILVKDVEDLTGSVADRIFALSVVVAPSIKLIPVDHSLYDYGK